MIYGTAKEVKQQMMYVAQRAELYMNDDRSSCTVIEVDGPKGARTTFRFPDTAYRAAMDMHRQHCPAAAVGNMTHFCGLPRIVTFAFSLCKPFIPKETYDRML